MKKINDIVNKSEEILDKIGYPLYAGTYLPDEYFGREYKFDILKIDLYDSNLSNRNMHIYIGNKEVLNYNYNKEYKFKDGKWVELIDTIHEEIPNIIKAREKKNITENFKKKELKDLEEYFKYYVDCEENRKDIFEILNHNLNNNNIFITRNTEQMPIIKICSGEKEYINTNKYIVKHNDEEVAKFSGNKFNVLSNIDDYKQGIWTNNFKTITDKIKRVDEEYNQKLMDNSSEKAIKKLRKTLNKN